MDRGILAASNNCEEGSNESVLGDWSESFVIVFPPSLGKAFCTEAGFVENIVFGAENSARFNHFWIPWAWNEILGLILHDRVVLFLHGELKLLGILGFHCLAMVSWPFPIPFQYCLKCSGNSTTGWPIQWL
jgi:hypothetical protein